MKPRIMFMISSLNGGGAERVTVNLANRFAESHEVCLLILFRGNRDDYSLSEKVTVYRFCEEWDAARKKNILLRGFLLKIFRCFWVRKKKRLFRPDVTISMMRAQNLYNVICGGSDYKILSERNDPSKASARDRRLKQFCYRKADHVVFQSKRVQSMFSPEIRAKSSVILNPVDVRVERAARPVKRIVTVGRLTEQKNHRMLLTAFARFSAEKPEYVLEIYGKGPLKEETEECIRRLGLTGRAFIRGFSPRVHEEIRDAEMFVLSSDYEGLSNALLEAMMMGMPCISTDCAGSDEVLKNGGNGLLVPVKDADAFYKAMLLLAEDEALRERLGRAAKETSRTFHIDEIIEQWENLLIKEVNDGKNRQAL